MSRESQNHSHRIFLLHFKCAYTGVPRVPALTDLKSSLRELPRTSKREFAPPIETLLQATGGFGKSCGLEPPTSLRGSHSFLLLKLPNPGRYQGRLLCHD